MPWRGTSTTFFDMDVLLNPYFLGYVLLILLLVRFGNMLKAMHLENVERRAAAERNRQAAVDADV